MRCAVLRTDADYIEHEYNLNCLDYATSNLHKIQGCFIEVANPQIVAKFVSDSAAMCDLWTRIAKVCSALHIALLHINEATGTRQRVRHPHYGCLPIRGFMWVRTKGACV